jgi:death on curing protein
VAEPVWVLEQSVIILHNRSIALHGGAEGVRDPGLLSSALQRPQNRHHYEGVEDIPELAATYAAAVSANHPFIDGNKRAAFQCMALFLRQNGYRLTASQADAALTILALAAGKMDIQQLSGWVRINSAAAPSSS